MGQDSRTLKDATGGVFQVPTDRSTLAHPCSFEIRAEPTQMHRHCCTKQALAPHPNLTKGAC